MGFVDRLPYEKAKERFEKYVKTFGEHNTAARIINQLLQKFPTNKSIRFVDRGNEADLIYGYLIIHVSDPIEVQRLKKTVFFEEEAEEEEKKKKDRKGGKKSRA